MRGAGGRRGLGAGEREQEDFTDGETCGEREQAGKTADEGKGHGGVTTGCGADVAHGGGAARGWPMVWRGRREPTLLRWFLAGTVGQARSPVVRPARGRRGVATRAGRRRP